MVQYSAIWCMNCEQSAKSAIYHNCIYQNNLLEFKSAILEPVWDYLVSLGLLKVVLDYRGLVGFSNFN